MSEATNTEELGVLRQLLHREQAFFDIEHQQAKSFEKDSFDSIKNLIFLTRKVYSLHLSVLEQSKSGKTIDVPDLAALSQGLPAGFSATQQRSYQSAVATIVSDSRSLAQLLSDHIKEFPEARNYTVFSLIPALFSCLWSLEESNKFVDLLLHFSPSDQIAFSQVLLVHPSFYVFLSSIQADASSLLSESQTIKPLLDLFRSRSFLLPSTIRIILSKHQDPLQFFRDCIIRPLLEKPFLYGLVPSSEQRSFSSITPLLETQEEDLKMIIKHLNESANSIQVLPSEDKLASVIADNVQPIYLYKEDCQIISKLSNADLVAPTVDGAYQISFKMISSPSKKLDENMDTDSDPFEALLRALVIQLDVSSADSNIISTLDTAIVLRAGASRLQYELRLDEFKQMKKERNAPDDIPYYVNLLTSAYEQRMKHRKATLSNSNNSDVFKVQHLQGSQAVQFLLQTRQMTFFNMWNDSGVFEELNSKIGDLCNDRKLFASTYKGLIQQFSSFVEEKKLGMTKDQFAAIVYSRLTQKVTLSAYKEAHPELVELDNQVHEMIETKRDQLYASNSLAFLQVFKDDPSLMGLASQHLKRAFDENSAIAIAEWIDRSLSALIHVLSFQGMKEIGADHWLPMTLILFIHVNPKSICSVASYMHHVLLTLPDNNPVTQSIEYNVTMTHSASSYFERELSKYK